MAKRFKLARCSKTVDRLSLLPDDILIHILSLLPFKEAAKTSVLARRWRFLSLYLSDLDFDASDKIAHRVRHGSKKKIFGKDSKTAASYVEWVDGVISNARHRLPANTLRRFCICFRLDKSFSRKIHSWLAFSFEKGVEVLELDCCLHAFFDKERRYRFPSIQPSLFPKLRLLKSLSLTSVAINNGSLERLLLRFEFLERLHLCDLKSLTEVSITGSVSRLKHIDVLHSQSVRSILISAPTPDLVSLKYPPYADPVHVEHAPRLVDLLIGQYAGSCDHFNLLSHPLLCYIPQLQSLHLNTSCWYKAEHWLPHLPDLSGLKHLKLSLNGFDDSVFDQARPQRNLRGLITLIKAASCVQQLTLLAEFSLDKCLKISEEFYDLDLRFLRVIEYVGFHGCKVERNLIMHLIKGVASLEKLIIDCRTPAFLGCVDDEYGDTKREIKKWKRSAVKLKKALPSKVELELPDQ